MKKSLALVAFLFLIVLVLSPTAQAQMGSMMGLDNDETTAVSEGNHAESVETVIQDILEQQNVSTIQDLNLSKISDNDWEALGDAVMELQHPGEAHEAMDQMMGGEGSESLRQMHINMGQAYLGYGSTGNDNAYYGPGMMGGSAMMGYGNNSRNFGAPSGMMGFGSMMGYGGSAVYSILSSITWLFAIGFLASGTYFFLKGAHKK